MRQQQRFRISPRRKVNMPVILEAGASRTMHRANLVDLGLAGAKLSLMELVAAGIQVSFEIPSAMLWNPLRLRGHVVWSQFDIHAHEAYLGVRFDHDSAASLLCLFELLSSPSLGNR